MLQAARNLEFETAAALRDEIFDMERTLKEKTGDFAVGLALEGTTDIPARRGARPARQGPAKPGEPGYKTPRARKNR